ncbi:MAG: hypothetical protein ACOY3Z_01075 [Thermodesulfobacteriota bacterium]
MTGRLAIIAGLLLLLLGQGRGVIVVWRERPPRAAAQEKHQQAAKAAPATGRFSLQPPVQGAAPEFNQGYLFNAERSLAGDGARGPQAKNAVNVGWDKMQYNGSIIGGSETKALLSYPLGGQPASPGGGIPQAHGFLRVVVGDMVNGYRVTEILPERIVFAKGEQKIIKPLHERGRERFQPQQSGSAPAAGQPPPAPPPAAAPGQEAAKPQAGAAPAAPPRRGTESPLESGAPRPSTPRKRPLQPQNPDAPDGKNILQMLMERQRQLNQSRPKDEKNFTP